MSVNIPTPSSGFGRCYLFHHLVEIEACGLLTRGKLLEARKPFANEGLGRNQDKRPIGHPLVVEKTFVASLEWIGAKVVNFGNAQIREVLPPNIQSRRELLFEAHLPVQRTNCEHITVVTPVQEAFAR